MPENTLLVPIQLFEDFSTSFSTERERQRQRQKEREKEKEREGDGGREMEGGNRKMVRKHSEYRGLAYPQFLQNCNCLWIHMVSRGRSKIYFISVETHSE